MPLVGDRADALLWKFGSAEVAQFIVIGTVPGVLIEMASAANGPGTGMIKSIAGGAFLAWRAPGSSTFGTPVATGGAYSQVLEDGEDRDKFVRVDHYAAYAKPGTLETRVFLHDVFNNAIADDDVTAAEAAAGYTQAHTVTMRNIGPYTMTELVVWIDPASPHLLISDDGAAWQGPFSEAFAMAMPDLAPTGEHTLHIQRNGSADEPCDPEVINHLHARWYGLG